MISNGGNASGGGVTFWPLTLLNNHDSAAAVTTSPSWSWFATGGTVLATLLGSVFLVLGKRQKSVRKAALKKELAEDHHHDDGGVEAEPVAIEIGVSNRILSRFWIYVLTLMSFRTAYTKVPI